MKKNDLKSEPKHAYTDTLKKLIEYLQSQGVKATICKRPTTCTN